MVATAGQTHVPQKGKGRQSNIAFLWISLCLCHYRQILPTENVFPELSRHLSLRSRYNQIEGLPFEATSLAIPGCMQVKEEVWTSLVEMSTRNQKRVILEVGTHKNQV